jgi:hypothetical protein
MDEHYSDREDDSMFANYTIPTSGEERVNWEHSSEPIRAFTEGTARELMVYGYHGTYFGQSSLQEPIKEHVEEINDEPLRAKEITDVQGKFSYFPFFSFKNVCSY